MRDVQVLQEGRQQGRIQGREAEPEDCQSTQGVPEAVTMHTPETRKRAYAKVRQRREDWLEKNGPCKKCGSMIRLEVDHINPTTKVSHTVWSWREPRRLAELKKCQVLCHDCHLEKTRLSLVKPLVHGTLTGYKTCRCSLCLAANRAYKLIYNRTYRSMKRTCPSEG